mmetsp:Transcript_50116/g.127542  ORF Transcript_50116/g.127542 Transcript_50116/m.127542 type:complete len:209 (+) Transcript_50116:391-1017(+)
MKKHPPLPAISWQPRSPTRSGYAPVGHPWLLCSPARNLRGCGDTPAPAMPWALLTARVDPGGLPATAFCRRSRSRMLTVTCCCCRRCCWPVLRGATRPPRHPGRRARSLLHPTLAKSALECGKATAALEGPIGGHQHRGAAGQAAPQMAPGARPTQAAAPPPRAAARGAETQMQCQGLHSHSRRESGHCLAFRPARPQRMKMPRPIAV